MFTFDYTLRLHDTDAAGVVYFANLLRIAHEAYEAYLASRGVSIRRALDDRTLALPIVHAEADFRAPVKLGDRLAVHLTIAEVGSRSFTSRYAFLTGDGALAAEARLVHAVLDPESGRATTLPDDLAAILKSG